MTSENPNLRTIEPFDPDKHDRAAFSCGVPQVDNFLKLTANKLSKADAIRVFVLTAGTNELIGFYALNAHSVDYRDLPPPYAKNRPSHGNIAAAYISMIGVDSRFQGQGFGEMLLVDAMQRIVMVSDQMGIRVIMLDVLDCGNERNTARRLKLYTEKFGFMPLPSNPLRLFIPVKTVKAALAG
ncbi:GNAT family N-acetyltransferase [Phyllobacterium leguminum]|uniref:Acetyltransferase (GNAT) family protein n=1 Tax=Phyllobacterium leguminum TaxID=314237 RepID=A0A318T834_9HYPH|nr:GNAT family N-acetyltransferase [Phyllobacterium leguminum]PYE88755.1 acetyltransferase (GNAT) family protein [Phyllobacterium leguminum]